MAGAGVTTESHGPTHDEVVGNMQAYAGADGGPAKHGVHVHPQHSDDDAAVAGHFLECVRGVFQSSDDERGYAEFCRVCACAIRVLCCHHVSCGSPFHTLPC